MLTYTVDLVKWKQQIDIHGPNSAVLKKHNFQTTCADRVLLLVCASKWLLDFSLLYSMWRVFEMLCVSYATWKEKYRWNVITGSTRDDSVNVKSLTVFVACMCSICCCWMVALLSSLPFVWPGLTSPLVCDAALLFIQLTMGQNGWGAHCWGF